MAQVRTMGAEPQVGPAGTGRRTPAVAQPLGRLALAAHLAVSLRAPSAAVLRRGWGLWRAGRLLRGLDAALESAEAVASKVRI